MIRPRDTIVTMIRPQYSSHLSMSSVYGLPLCAYIYGNIYIYRERVCVCMRESERESECGCV